MHLHAVDAFSTLSIDIVFSISGSLIKAPKA